MERDKEAFAKKEEEVFVPRKPIGLLMDFDHTFYPKNSNNQVYEALSLLEPEKKDRIEPQLTKKEIDSETRDFLNSTFCNIGGTLKYPFYHDLLNGYMSKLNAENHVSIITATSYPAATLFLFQKAGFEELIQFENIHTVSNINNDKIPKLKSEKVLEIVGKQNLQAVVFVDDNHKTYEEVKKLNGIDIQGEGGEFKLIVKSVYAGKQKESGKVIRKLGDPEILDEMMGYIEKLHYFLDDKLKKSASASAPFLFSEQPTGKGDTTSLSKRSAVEIPRGGPERGTFYENEPVVQLQKLNLMPGQPKQLDLESGKSASASALPPGSEEQTGKGKKIVRLTMEDVVKKPLSKEKLDLLAFLGENIRGEEKLSGLREVSIERKPVKKPNHKGEQTQGAVKSTKPVPADRPLKKRP